MSDPTQTVVPAAASFLGALTVAAGPQLGPWLAVVLAAFIGSLWTLGVADTTNKVRAGLLLLRTVATALVLTGGIAAALITYTDVPVDHVLPLTAFALGAWFEQIKDVAIARIKSKIGGV